MTDPVVAIKQGKIRGAVEKDIDGGSFYKFVGVPYAEPPLGSLRFKAPQPVEVWNEIRNFTDDGGDPGCIAYQSLSKAFTGSEDCLYLNVFTKELPKPGLNLQPVLVFIHGGGFTMGSGSMQGPKHLLTEDIVLVTLSYRTGILGFLSSDDLSVEAPGNAGLKDQTFALKWVQENISSFNGDPNNVTIFGISAGGASVSFQILSPSAKGLFHKAIIQSGNALSPFAWGQKNSIQVVEKLGKTASTEKEALEVLRTASVEELLKAADEIPDDLFETNKRRPFSPVIEKPNSTAFLTENPLALYTSGRYNQVPIIQGIVSNEGLLYDAPFYQKKPVNAEHGVLWYFGLQGDKEKSTKIVQLLEDFYFKNGVTKDAVYKFVADICFMYPAVESTKLISKMSAHPVYFYLYSREVGLSNAMKAMYGDRDGKLRGVPHGGDQAVLFNNDFLSRFGLGKLIELDEENRDAIKQFVKLWVDFARTGKPYQNWEPVTADNDFKYLDIDKDLTLKTNPFWDRFAIWDKIHKSAPKIDVMINEQP